MSQRYQAPMSSWNKCLCKGELSKFWTKSSKSKESSPIFLDTSLQSVHGSGP